MLEVTSVIPPNHLPLRDLMKCKYVGYMQLTTWGHRLKKGLPAQSDSFYLFQHYTPTLKLVCYPNWPWHMLQIIGSFYICLFFLYRHKLVQNQIMVFFITGIYLVSYTRQYLVSYTFYIYIYIYMCIYDKCESTNTFLLHSSKIKHMLSLWQCFQ